MFIAEVIGNVWGTRKHPSVAGKKLLLVRPIDPFSEAPLGAAVMAVEGGVGAGPGSVVLVLDEGGSARAVLGDAAAPVRTVICGIVDGVSSRGRVKRYA
ncbi:MAG: EutN/CcmL family microcompartment protein [Elusimicrobia bacterium]|nr:EutN/CcmL family microcompartment protein [Elusimicrobiota bacterium]MDE2236336.1 EutN/CcmL family microcompartment protein [Elusimicrobiota bacterium]MDE2426491.1 EutN/CcmL family microcompartment protein [Elusimicrobiota bacterium]